MSAFKEWTCTFPGKMGLSWKRAWGGVGTKEEAEAEAAKYCNVVAVPLELFEKMKEHERRMVQAERKLESVCTDYNGNPWPLTENPLLERIRRLEVVATAAMKLLRPPYVRGSGILTDPSERHDWKSLSKALADAGYEFEVYT